MNPDHPILVAILLLGSGAMPIGLVVILVQMFRDDYEKTRRVVLSERAHSRKMRFRGWFGPAILLVTGSFFLAILWVARPGRNPPKAGSPPLIILLLFALACFAAAPKVWLTYRRKRLAGPIKPKPAGASRPSPSIPPWVWVVVIGIFSVALYTMAPRKKPNPGNDPPPVSTGWLCLGPVAVVLFIAVPIAIQRRRYHDPVVERTHRRALDGDVEGAIAELHHEILDRGPTANRINGLVLLLFQNKDFPAAVEWARKGMALAPNRIDLRANFALALIETGQAAEAEAIYAEMIAQDDSQYIYFLNLASALVALGRLDEAENRLQVAEEKLRATRYLTTKDVKAPVREAIAIVRVKIAEARGLKDATGLFPEL